MAPSLDRLLRPRSIAVFGGREAGRVVEQCRKIGYAGEIWPVHPVRAEIGGLRCFRAVDELPAAPDAAFLGVNRHRTVELVRELAADGAGGAVAYASGFREAAAVDNEGSALETALLEAAGEMPIVGPNCYGFINYLDGALLWPDQHGGERLAQDASGVAILTQSSNIALNLSMQARGLPLAYIATLGNQAQIGIARLALSLLEDPRVTALGLHVEGFDDVAALERLAQEARRRRTPIAALWVGASPEARAAALSHTASLTGSREAARALFARLGIAEVGSLPALLETLKLLHVVGPLDGADIGVMGCSGGDASLIADAVRGSRLRLRPLNADQATAVKATLGPLVAVANPLDYHTFIWAKEAAMADTFGAMMRCGFDLTALVLDFPRPDRCSAQDWLPAARGFVTAMRRTAAAGALIATMPENVGEARARELMGLGLAPLLGVTEAVQAIEAAAEIGAAWRHEPPVPLARVDGQVHAAHSLDEAEAKAELAVFGVPVPPGRRAGTAGETVLAAEMLGYPVAVKALGLAHKTEAGAVRIGLASAGAVREAATALGAMGRGLLLVERMIEGAVAELVVGVGRVPGLGLLMTVGIGGTLVELTDDRTSLLLPVDEAEIHGALLSLRLAPLLTGYRGRPPADLDATVAAAVAVQRFALAHADRLVEVEINPLIVCRAREGAYAVDALLRLEERS
jgi:acyl-CoA synthetase (NDP forming)